MGAVVSTDGESESGPNETRSAHTIVKDDYPAALALARDQGKLVVVNFTGYT